MSSPEPVPFPGAGDPLSRLVTVYHGLRHQLEALESLPEGGPAALHDQLHRCVEVAREEALHASSGLVHAYVDKFSPPGEAASEDLVAAGMVGLLRAIDTYAPTRGRFGQWAFKPIQREVLQAVRRSTFDHPPEEPGPSAEG